MSGVFGYSREAIRVKVKKCEGSQPPEFRKFSVDPQITSFEVLQSILGKAFDLKGDFAICYRVYDVSGHEIYMPLLSDWDLDAAFLKAYNMSVASSSEPCLCLRVDLKPFEECSDDWELRQNVPIITQIKTAACQEAKPSPRLQGIFNQMGKTLNMVQKAFNFGEDGSTSLAPPRLPLSDAEFRTFLDPVGQILYTKELRSVIYFGGIDPSLRKVVWKHLLNVYPDGMTGRARMDYIKKKASEYINLREIWKTAIAQGPVVGELAYTTGMVRKDVLRTDRHHPFYAGSDDNQNIASLFNILTTRDAKHPQCVCWKTPTSRADTPTDSELYPANNPIDIIANYKVPKQVGNCRLQFRHYFDSYALNHPKVSYCQGMSDLASPLLVTMNDEAHAYICFCALMQRLSTNFMIDGIAMTQKFTHLAEGLMYYDPEFYNYLKIHQADDLLFCYRWLLLEMKREFAFEDSLRMLEVLWSSLPSDPPEKELKLFDIQFQPIMSTPPISPLLKTPRESAYTKVCAIRRQSSSISLNNFKASKPGTVKRQNHSLDETISKSKNILEAKLKHQSLDDAALTRQKIHRSNDISPKSPKNELRPRSTSPLEPKSDSAVIVNNRLNSHKVVAKSKSASLSTSMTNLIKNTKRSGHFKDLKDKIAAAKLFSASLDMLDSEEKNHSGKMIKNLNEFFNFANNSNRGDLLRGHEKDLLDNPKILLTKSSFDDSESSSVVEKTRNNCSSTSTNEDTFDEYSPDDSQEYFPLTTSVTRELRLELENLDRKVFGDKYIDRLSESPSECSQEKTEKANLIIVDHECAGENIEKKRSSDDIFIWENPLMNKSSPNTTQTPDEQAEIEFDSEAPTLVNETSARKTVTPIKIINQTPLADKNKHPLYTSEDGVFEENIVTVNGSGTLPPMTNSCEEVTEAIKSSNLLPPPNEFGGGNPFLMFLCITVLLQHREHIISKAMDYNEMAMHFDKMVRKHNVTRVLNQARQMYARYIKQHTMAQHKDSKHEDC